MADLTITAASVLNTAGTIIVGTAGETITAGMPVYLKSSDSRLWKAQADGTAAEAAVVGVSLHASLAGQPLSYQTGGTMNIGATTVAATVYVVSAAAGAIAPIADLTSGQRIVHLGYATAADGSFTTRITNTGATVAA